MTETWESCKKKIGVTPYVDWWEEKEKAVFDSWMSTPLGSTQMNLARGHTDVDTADGGIDRAYNGGVSVPLPAAFRNKMDEHEDWADTQIADNLPGDVPDDAVITGILDTGISLNHMMTNHCAGKTRFISAWQQGSTMPLNEKDSLPLQPWLPCGKEIFADDINTLLEEYGDGTGAIDEVAFNRAAGLVEPTIPFGHDDLEMGSAHGTHILGLAAGHTPAPDPQDLRDRIIAINLPTQYIHGSGGNFLAYFAVYGVKRILHVADSLWQKNCKNKDDAALVGYPIVINFSYGMVAGSKDGQYLFEQALEDIIEERRTRLGDKASPVRIIMPVGNDNLKRGAASAVMAKSNGKTKDARRAEKINLPWRIQPGDSTANFVELWTEFQPKANFQKTLSNLKVSVTPPGSPTPIQLEKLKDGEYQDFGDYARVYVQVQTADTKTDKKKPEYQRLFLLICVSATDSVYPEQPLAPAGLWNIDVEYAEETPVEVSLYIQTDQSAVVTSKTGLRSYFDSPHYRTHVTEHPDHDWSETGAVADLFSTNPKGETNYNDSWSKHGPVQREGMHNALASSLSENLIAIGSYDDSNGHMTGYSAATRGETIGSDGAAELPKGRAFITACLPGENAPNLFGLLGPGSNDGSVVASRGTSMSTALATRLAVSAFLECDGTPNFDIGSDSWFREMAAFFEGQAHVDHLAHPLAWPKLDSLSKKKLGSGRLPDPREQVSFSRLGDPG